MSIIVGAEKVGKQEPVKAPAPAKESAKKTTKKGKG